MATNWIIPAYYDVAKIISMAVLQRANENTDDGSLEAAQQTAVTNADYKAPFDPTLDDRIADQLDLAINQFRGAIQIAGKQPLSLTPASVPPDACYKHCLTLAAYGVISSTLNLQWVIATEKGDASPITAAWRDANKYLEKVTRGLMVIPPTDPTGRDYINPINVPWFSSCPNPFPPYDSTKAINPPVEAVRFGASAHPVDLATFGSVFDQPAPWWFPAGEIGQP
jgi:hypothetical protein